MFEALGHQLSGDYLDLTFRDTSKWPKVSDDEGMPPSLFVSIGDEAAGPDIQMVVMSPPPADMFLDTHYHGCDQFRVVLQGDFKVQRKRMTAAVFGYQVSGVPYREGVLADTKEDLWMFIAHGERRGARATMLRDDGDFIITHFGEDQLDRPATSADDPYWDQVPGGSKGTVGYGSSLGRAVGGFSWSAFGEEKGWEALTPGVFVTAGVMSNVQSGPILLTVRAEAGVVAVPHSTYETEVVLLVVSGSCHVGEKKYVNGEVRVQRAGASHEAITAGPNGLEAIFFIADRRAKPRVEDDTPVGAAWLPMLDRITSEMIPAN